MLSRRASGSLVVRDGCKMTFLGGLDGLDEDTTPVELREQDLMEDVLEQ